MASFEEIRSKYPQYQDMSDQSLADALHAKYYSDTPTDEFYGKIFFEQAQAKEQPSMLEAVDRSVFQGGTAFSNGTRTIAVGNSTRKVAEKSYGQMTKSRNLRQALQSTYWICLFSGYAPTSDKAAY